MFVDLDFFDLVVEISNEINTVNSIIILGNKKDIPNTKNINKKVFAYEDLIENPLKVLDKIIFFISHFIKVDTNEIKNRNIINSTGFERLKSLENEGKFKESVYDDSGKIKNFFHRGPKNKWQNQLDINIKNEIENKLSVEMKELGYL